MRTLLGSYRLRPRYLLLQRPLVPLLLLQLRPLPLGPLHLAQLLRSTAWKT